MLQAAAFFESASNLRLQADSVDDLAPVVDAARRCANLDLPEKAYKLVGIDRKFFEDYDCEAGAVRNARLYTRAAKTRRGVEPGVESEVESGVGVGRPLKHKAPETRKNSSRSGSRSKNAPKACERQPVPDADVAALSIEPPLKTGYERDEDLAGVAPTKYTQGQVVRDPGQTGQRSGQTPSPA